jgi:copper(I)-binding protein
MTRAISLCAVLVVAIVVGILMACLGEAAAHGYKKRSLEIIHPWTLEQDDVVRPTAIVGMELCNTGRAADRLVGVQTTDAASAQIIATPGTTSGRTPAAIEVKPGETLRLSAAGPHIRLDGVKPKLFAYNILQITLVFERAGRVKVEVQVEERPD